MAEQSVFTVEEALQVRSFVVNAPIRFSRGGGLLAYVLEQFQGRGQIREEVWVVGVDTGEAVCVLPEARVAWGASWSPVAETLAFYADTGEGLQLWIWEAATRQARRVAAAPVVGFYRFEAPRWTPDGRALICKVGERCAGGPAPVAPDEVRRQEASSPTARVWQSPRTERQSRQGLLQRYRPPGLASVVLARVEVATGEVLPLTEEAVVHGWELSPDGRELAFLRRAELLDGSGWIGFELCVVPLAGGETRRLTTSELGSYGTGLAWSPDGKWLAYRPNGEVAVLPAAGGEARVLTHFGFERGTEHYEAPVWSADGSFLLLAEHGPLWRIPVEGGVPVDLRGERTDLRVGGLIAPAEISHAWTPAGEDTVLAWASTWEASGVAAFSLRTGGPDPVWLGGLGWHAPCRVYTHASAARGLIASVIGDATHPEEVWVSEVPAVAPRRLTISNPRLEPMRFSPPQLVSWSARGGTHRSAFFPPANPSLRPPYPTVFVVYLGPISAGHRSFGCEGAHCHNVQIYTNHGYAVSVTDMLVDDSAPAESIAELLTAAVAALVDAGLTDPARLGLLGHSYGSYIVNCAITRLDCFAAAVSDSGFCNLTSFYGLVEADGETGYAAMCEAQMGAPPWEAPERYVENSPLFRLDHVTTPVLILHGTGDPLRTQSWELLSGLRRLGKTADLALYEGEPHSREEWSRTNLTDRWQRVLGWFDRYLAPTG